MDGGGPMFHVRSFPELRLEAFLHTGGVPFREPDYEVNVHGMSFGRVGDTLQMGMFPDSLQLRTLPSRFSDEAKQALSFFAGG